MTSIAGPDAKCRFLGEPQGDGGEFNSLLQQVGLGDQTGRSLREMVRLGWIKPRMRIAIPREFILGWENFPTYPRHGTFNEEDDWAAEVWSLATHPLSAADPSPGWYRHPLDCDGVLEEIRPHVIPSGPGCPEPEIVCHPRGRGRKVFPWVDFFGYWQSYRLFETFNAVKVMAPLENTPNLEETLSHLPDHLPLLKKKSDARMELIERQWLLREPVFEWVSQFRTLLDLPTWLDNESSWKIVQAGSGELAEDLGLEPEAMRADILEVLLVMWADWARKGTGVPPGLRRSLQMDIFRAVEFHNLLTDDQIDPTDGYWDPPDRQSRRWARLKEALPFESDRARAGFPETALMYLNRFNNVADNRALSLGKVRRISEDWWSESEAFRRFILVFDRLHQHFSGSINNDNDVGLIEQTPADFLVLTALHAEKLLAELRAEARPGEQAPTTRELLKYWAGRVGRVRFGVTGEEEARFKSRIGRRLRDDTKLHDLPLKPENPFISLGKDHGGLAFFENAIVNTMILRNYSAHHSCLDFELIHTEWARDPLESIIVVVLTVLQTARLNQKGE